MVKLQVLILITGRGYVDPIMIPTVGGTRIGPQIEIDGIGRDAVPESEINELGQITKVNIVDPGIGYDSDTTLTVRNFSVLVSSDPKCCK